MSRITGFSNLALSNNETKQLWEKMLTGISQPGWKFNSLSSGSARMGWCGWHQPNTAARGKTQVVIDGYIYNRNDWDTCSNDAELFIQLYEQYGFTNALKKINGDFAIALFDTSDNCLWLGRDRIGLKPLYYAVKNGWLAFASRPKALLCIPSISKEINIEFTALFAASHYRYFDNQPEKSPYKEISQLPAGHAARFKDGELTLSKYWDLSESPDFGEPIEQLASRYRDLLIDSVAIRYQSASKPAFTLSGGMDSSSVLASAVHFSGKKQHAFSTVYKDKTYDESEEIRSMLEANVKEWHAVELDNNPDVFGTVRSMVELHDEPIATATWLSHFLLCQEVAKQSFGGLFGGLGGDELNAGEYEYFFFNFADLAKEGKQAELENEIKKWIEYHDHPIFKKDRKLVDHALKHMVDLSRPGVCLPEKGRLSRYHKTLDPNFFDIESFAPIMDHPFSSYLKNRTYQDIFRETAPCCLRAEDRQTVAFGLDNFLPFFDYRLVEFMFRVPGHLKINKGVTKHLLRMAMKGILPDETRNRIKKTGWNAPAHVWFSGKRLEPLQDLVHSHKFKQRGIYNISEVDRLIAEHDQIISSGVPKDNHMMFLWQLVNLEIWLNWLEDLG